MRVESTGAVLSTVFVDYDNIYLSLKRKNEEAAKRFAKDAALWLREIESGRLITPTAGTSFAQPRRIVMSRCYGNPVPRRNASDNSTDMNSFPFVRHHFLRAGFEVIDCPPLTAQLKNSADIRMVMDVRDMLTHETRFEEFILLSGDADFTPVLHRLRAHARRTVVFANDHTAQPYTAISDGEIREADLISLLLEGRLEAEPRQGGELRALSSADLESVRKAIVAEVVGAVRASAQPMPLEALADRAVRALGHDKTVGSAWGGAGTFRDLLAKALPQDIRLTGEPPYFAYDATRQIGRDAEVRTQPQIAREPRAELPGAPLPQSRPEPRADYGRELRAEPSYPAAPAARAPDRDLRAGDLRAGDMRPGGERAVASERGAEPQRGLAERAEPAPRYEEPRYALPREARGELGEAPRETRVPRDRQPEPAPRAERPSPPRQEIAAPAYGQSGYFAPPPERAPLAGQPPAGRTQVGDAAPHQAGAPLAYGARPAYGAPQPHPAPAPAAPRGADQASQIQQSIARIHEACQAPPLSPPEYRVLFEVMAEEIGTNNLSGQQTLVNIAQRARDMGLDVRRDDVRFVLEVVSETDPWFEQGASANLFASRFRNFVVARCRSQGLNLSAEEIDLIDAWFGGAPPSQRSPHQSAPAAPAPQTGARPAAPAAHGPPPQGYAPPAAPPQQDRWQGQTGAPPAAAFGSEADEEFPRIVRSRLRG